MGVKERIICRKRPKRASACAAHVHHISKYESEDQWRVEQGAARVMERCVDGGGGGG